MPTVITSSQPYQSLNGATVAPFVLDQDEGAVTISLPFTFRHFNQSFTTVYASINGFVTLDAPCSSGSSCYSNGSLPSTSTPNTVIAGLWDDMEIGPNTQVRYVVGPSDVTIEWFRIQRLASTAEATFSVKLTAGGSILIHHGSMVSPSPTSFSFTTGYEGPGGAQGANLLACASSCAVADFVPDRLFTIGEPDEAELGDSSVTISNFVMLGDGNLTFDLQSNLRNFGRTAANNFLWRAFLSWTSNGILPCRSCTKSRVFTVSFWRQRPSLPPATLVCRRRPLRSKKAEPEAAGQTNVDAQAQTLIRDIEILVDQISQDIEQNPRMTAIAAFGLGLLLGLTLSR